jgi:simple sugar transport system permease protein
MATPTRLPFGRAPAAEQRPEVAPLGIVRRLLRRPELGALGGAVVIFVFFAIEAPLFATRPGIANFLDPASLLGLMAVPVALLMIGGEFDLSSGVMTGATGTVTALFAVNLGWNVWAAMVVSLLFAVAVGLFNGFMVIKTGLPSFIVTLATFFILQGADLYVTKLATNQVLISGVETTRGFDSASRIFASLVGGFQVSILYWLFFTALLTWVLMRTSYGNWIFAVGGSAASARQVGVPVAFTKVSLFVMVSTMAWLVGTIVTLRFHSATVTSGVGLEFQYIVAAVIGGCLLTGGYGSAIGASLGALIFGMVNQGIVLSRWDSNLFLLFLGLMLLIATLVNVWIRRQAERSRAT